VSLAVPRIKNHAAGPDANKAVQRSNSSDSLKFKKSVEEDQGTTEQLALALAEREHQAQLAAEIGKALLEQNEELRNEVEALRQRVS
jgi:hypothetical protein